MSKPDLNYLRAEIALAQSNGETKAYVSVPEMQSLLHRLAAFELDAKFEVSRQMAGFIQGSQLKSIIEGRTKSASIRRRKTDICTTALYYIDIVEPTEVSDQ